MNPNTGAQTTGKSLGYGLEHVYEAQVRLILAFAQRYPSLIYDIASYGLHHCKTKNARSAALNCSEG